MFRMCIACSIIEKMTKDRKNAHSTLLGHSTVRTYGTPFATKIPPRVCVYKIDSLNDFVIERFHDRLKNRFSKRFRNRFHDRFPNNYPARAPYGTEPGLTSGLAFNY